MSGSVQIVTAANAYVSGKLEFAHAAGTYIPADVQHRLASVFGEDSTYLTGIDVFGRGAQRLALKRSTSLGAVADTAAAEFEHGLARLDVRPTEIVRSDDPRVLALLATLLQRLRHAGLITRKPIRTFRCSACLEYLSKSDIRGGAVDHRCLGPEAANREPPLAGASCGVCGGGPVESFVSEQWFLKLARDGWLQEWHAKQSGKVARLLFKRDFTGDFAEWSFTRPQYHGPKVPWDDESFIYLWLPSLLTKFVATNLEKVHSADRSPTIWRMFFGKNITQYYSLVLPIVARFGLCLGETHLRLCARGFSQPDANQSMISLSDAFAWGTSDELRFCASYLVPDDAIDFHLRRDTFSVTRQSILVKVFDSFLAEAGRVAGASSAKLAANPRHCSFEALRLHYASGAPRKLLHALEALARQGLAILRCGPAARLQEVASLYITVFNCLQCYMPTRLRGAAALPVNRDGIIKLE